MYALIKKRVKHNERNRGEKRIRLECFEFVEPDIVDEMSFVFICV